MRDEEEHGMATIERVECFKHPWSEEIAEIAGIPPVVGDGTIVVNAGNDQWAEVSVQGFEVRVVRREDGKVGVDRCVVRYNNDFHKKQVDVKFPQGHIEGRPGGFSFGKTGEPSRKLFGNGWWDDVSEPHTTVLVVDDDALVMHANGDIALCRSVGEDAHPYLAPSENVMVATGAHSFTVLPGKVRHHYAPSLG